MGGSVGKIGSGNVLNALTKALAYMGIVIGMVRLVQHVDMASTSCCNQSLSTSLNLVVDDKRLL